MKFAHEPLKTHVCYSRLQLNPLPPAAELRQPSSAHVQEIWVTTTITRDGRKAEKQACGLQVPLLNRCRVYTITKDSRKAEKHASALASLK